MIGVILMVVGVWVMMMMAMPHRDSWPNIPDRQSNVWAWVGAVMAIVGLLLLTL